ncbi:MAG: gamma carbonic anhydrase family protein [Clostridia bacterium]|nr:gamma carbonic anhydrase family protein [Clostridia bacterium]
MSYISKNAVVTGNVKIGEDSSVWHMAVIRGDLAPIAIGKGSNVQEQAVVHVDTDYGVKIGDNVTVGHGAIIHGCTIGNNTLIGMGAIILNGAVIGDNCIIGAGALVTGGTVVPDGMMALGSPAKVKRELRDEEIQSNTANALEYVRLAKESL